MVLGSLTRVDRVFTEQAHPKSLLVYTGGSRMVGFVSHFFHSTCSDLSLSRADGELSDCFVLLEFCSCSSRRLS